MSPCPPRDELQRFADGGLAEPALEAIGSHLDSCAACRTLVDATSKPWILAAAADRDTFEREAGFQVASRRVSQLDPNTRSPEETLDLTDPLPPIGRHVGPFVIHGLLGEGAMGLVYDAEDTQLQRRVALKVMKPRLAKNDTSRQRFLREARAAARLKHDRIVAIHSVGEADGVPYLVMELLPGESLGMRLRREPILPAAELRRIGAAVAEGLAAAHAAGLVHRDVKPDNIRLLPDGGVKLLDFGLARPMRVDAELTHDGAVLGTPAYMAPEQARSDALVDERTDLYGLGCVLYRAATGRLPHPVDDAFGLIMDLATREPEPVERLNSSIPADLAALIHRLLAKDPAARPQSAAEVAAMLGGTSAARRPRRRFAIAGVLLVALALGVWAAIPPTPGPASPVESTNRALAFTEASRAIIPGLSFEGLEACTLEFQVTPEPFEPKQSTHLIGVGRQCSVAIDPGGRLWSFGHRQDLNHFAISTSVPPPGRVAHIACVRSSRSTRFFVNGRLASMSNCPGGAIHSPKSATASEFVVGGFVGTVDEIRVSDIARYEWDYTPSERLEPDANTLGLYHCDEESGDVLIDASGRGKNGTLKNVRRVK